MTRNSIQKIEIEGALTGFACSVAHVFIYSSMSHDILSLMFVKISLAYYIYPFLSLFVFCIVFKLVNYNFKNYRKYISYLLEAQSFSSSHNYKLLKSFCYNFYHRIVTFIIYLSVKSWNFPL